MADDGEVGAPLPQPAVDEPAVHEPTARKDAPEPGIDAFLEEPTREAADWRSLWDRDLRFPVRSHRGLAGRFIVLFKRLLRPLVQVPQNDLWERQRIFNLILLEYHEQIGIELAALDGRVRHLETFMKEGLDEVMRYNDALFTRLDQKVDRYRLQAKELSSQLQAAVARAGEGAAPELEQLVEESAYLALESRFRGTREEIGRRIETYRPWLAGRTDVLDLGCGRGEALELLAEAGVPARGVDSSAEMVRVCRQRGLQAEEGDLLEILAQAPQESLDAVLSFHVIEHLPVGVTERLVRLAWSALRPGGVLILETPSPLSLLVSAERFWIDPTHRRPVHPASLRLVFEEAGFGGIERLDLNPFPDADRLPEIPLAGLEGKSLRALADRTNRLRDRLDDLLYGFQDFAMVGVKGR